MANEFLREELVLFDQLLAKFDSDNTVAKQAGRFTQPGQEMQRLGDTVFRPSPQISTTVSGLDITSKIGSITQLAVPASLTTIENVTFTMDALERRDQLQITSKAESSAQALSAAVNRAMADNVTVWGSLTVPVSGALTGYDDLSLADALMIENDVLGNDKTMVLNPRDYNAMGGNLQDRTLMPRSEAALDTTNLGPIANFNTFKTSYGPTLAAAAGGGAITITGDQSFVPSSQQATGTTLNQDNRTMNLLVSATANVKAGDKFTIVAVNAISHINKNPTGQLKTFTVIDVVDGTNLTIAPPIIDAAGGTDAEIDYANVDAEAKDGVAIVFLNGTTAQVNPFFMNNSIEVFGGRLAFPDEGVSVMRQSTDTGIEVIFARQGSVITGITTYRFTIFFGVTNLNPEMNGILIGNQ